MTSAARIAAYVEALRDHDWSFEYSDDGAVWRRGRAELLHLRAEQAALDADFAIWNRHCNPRCLNGRPYA